MLFFIMLFTLISFHRTMGQDKLYASQISKEYGYGKMFATFVTPEMIVVESFDHIKQSTWHSFIDTLIYNGSEQQYRGSKSRLSINGETLELKIQRIKRPDNNIYVVFKQADEDDVVKWNYRKNQALLGSYLKSYQNNNPVPMEKSMLHCLDSIATASKHNKFAELINSLNK